MLHPSYNDLMNVVNSDVEPGEHPVVNSRYSIVLATAKRARQLIAGSQPLVSGKYPKPLSIAIKELSTSAIKIDTEEEARAKREAAALAAEQAATTTETADSDEPETEVTLCPVPALNRKMSGCNSQNNDIYYEKGKRVHPRCGHQSNKANPLHVKDTDGLLVSYFSLLIIAFLTERL